MIKVLFVCVGNTCRSQIAEAFARRLSADLLDTHSAGTRPGDGVGARALDAMARRGYDLSEAVPKSVDEVPPGPYEWMVRMGCGDVLLVPALHREDWDLLAPSSLDDAGFEALCDDIEARVRDLTARIRTWVETTGFAPPVPLDGPPPAPRGDGADVLLAAPVSGVEPLPGGEEVEA